MDAFQKTVGHIIDVGIEGFINLHFLVAAIFLVCAGATQSFVLFAAVMTIVIPPVIKENKNWRLSQKQRMARLVHRKEGGEREAKYRKRLREECDDPDKWDFTKAFVHIRISYLLLGKLADRYNKWNASRRPSIRLAMMGANSASS